MDDSVTREEKPRRAGRRRGRLWLWWCTWTLVVSLGVFLGLWQWERADDKREYLAGLEAAPQLEAPTATPPDGSRLTLRGEYLAEETLFLDNRTLDGRLGVAVLTPLRGDDGRLWLVERGFLATGVSRATPEVATPTGRVTVQGRWQEAGDGAPLFGPNREGRRLQRIDLAAWSRDFAHAGWLHQARGPGQLASWWTPSVMPPRRHLGYAFQWWGLALAAALIMVVGGRRLASDDDRRSPSLPAEESRR